MTTENTPISITLNPEEYLALVRLAEQAAIAAGKWPTLRAFLQDIERANNIERQELLVCWLVRGKPLPSDAVFPQSMPVDQKLVVNSIGKPIAKKDVLAALDNLGVDYGTVLVTHDPAGLVGWTSFEVAFP